MSEFPNYRRMEMADDARKLGSAVGYALAEMEETAAGIFAGARRIAADAAATNLAEMYPHYDIRREYLDGIQEGRQTWIHGLFLDGTARTEAGRKMLTDSEEGAMRCCEWVE